MKDKKSILGKITASREASLMIVLIILCFVIQMRNSSFLTPSSIGEMLKNNAVIMVMTLGMLNVLLLGGIDISIASTLALSGMSVGMLIKRGIVTNTFLCFMIAILIGAVCGAIVGLTISKGRVLPIIATMGFMYIFRGAAYMVSSDEWAGADALGSFKDFALNSVLGINNIIWIVIVCYAIFFIVMKWTKVGRMVYAVGSNREATMISGIRADRVEFFVYLIMGILSGLAGAMAVTVYASAQPNMMYAKEMDVIAACVIGGVSTTGGRGSVGGALIGALIIAIIAKALPLVGIDAIAQNTVKGLIILVVIVLNVVTQRTMDKNVLKGREM
ncbi:MAG: ABC transporter permease [Lachnospiraceae bacterium]|nr:ABC transporter permease [Lachnospiraceae bacterium]